MNTDDADIIAPDAETAFILGNGPSLAGVDLHKLGGATFGMNAAYRYWREIDWRPSHYVCLDLVVGLSHKDAVAELIDENRIGAFLLRDNLIAELGERARTPKVVNFDSLSARDAMFNGASITTGSGAALWAGTLGFRTLVMLGIDGRYKEIVDGAEKRDGIELEIVRAGENPNYFHDGYQQPGDRYNIPNPRPDLHVTAWREAGRNLLAGGIRVYNGSLSSAVRCFPFVDVKNLLTVGAIPAPAEELLTPSNAAPSAQNPSARNRLTAFAKKNFLFAVSLGIATIAAIITWALLASPSPAVMISVTIGAFTAYMLVLAVLYTRFALIEHVNTLNREVLQLKARIRDLERF